MSQSRKQQTEKAASQELYQILFEQAPDGIFITDTQGRCLEVNHQGCAMLGYSREELLELSLPDLISVEDLARTPVRLTELSQSETMLLERQLRCRDGRLLPVEIKAQMLADSRVVGYVRDITERKRAEESLKASEARFATVFRASPLAISITQLKDNQYVEVNPAWQTTTGFNREETIGRTPFELNNWVNPNQREQLLKQLRQQGTVQGFEMQMRPQSGALLDLLISAEAVEVAGEPCLLALALDITARKQAEEALRASETKFSKAFLSSPDSIIISTLDEGRYLEVNDSFLRDTGYTREEIIGHTSAERNIWATPEDRARLVKELQMQGFVHNLEAQYCRKSGEIRDALISAEIIELADEKKCLLAVVRDISEYKQVETTLRQSEKKYRTLYESLMDGFAQVAMDGRIIECNEVYCQMLGYTKNELMELSYQDITPKRWHTYEAQIVAAQIMQRGYSDIYEKEYCRRDGTIFPVELRTILTRDEQGQPASMWAIAHDITERKRTEEAVIRLSRRMELILNSAGEGIYGADSKGKITFINPAMAHMLGWEVAELLGQSMHELCHHTRPDGRPYPWRECPLHTTIQDGRTHRGDDEFFWRKDGPSFPIEYISTPVYEDGRVVGTVVVVKDITERKQAEAVRRNQLEFINTLLETIPNPVFYKNPTGHYTGCNRAFEEFLGSSREEIIGKTVYEITPKDIAAKYDEMDQALYTNPGRQTYEWRVQTRANGERSVIFNKATTKDVQGNITGLVGIITDITERKLAEAELTAERASLARRVEERTAELSQANAELAQALRTKDEFLANMSHELRTPLNAILSLSEILQEQIYGPLNERQLKSIRTIEQSGHHLLDLISDILDLAKVEAGRLDIQLEVISIADICQASLLFIKEIVSKKSLQLSFLINDSLTKMEADPKRLKQMLINLLSNAVKFTPAQGQVSLEVTADKEAEVIRFAVRDTGIGISAAGLAQLFQPFTQLDARLNRQYEGTGLGLALVRRLAELHGGGVTVESDGVPGHGSCFTIVLPYRLPQKGEGNSITIEPETKYAPILSAGAWILLAEDNELNLRTLEGYLKGKGYQVIVARNGQEALNLAAESRPNLLLMDIQMPEIDGLEAIRRLRAKSEFAATPIIALTALAMPGDRERCLAAGANEYMVKPVSLKALVQVIENLLKGNKNPGP